MSVIFLLIIISTCIAICFLAAFLWAVKNNQFDDNYGPSVRILFEDEVPRLGKEENNPTLLKKDIN